MAKGKGEQTNPDEPSGLLAELQSLRGDTEGLAVEELDGIVLWYAVVALAKSGASIQLGVTKDGQSWACQLWEGKFPLKDYFTSTQALNKHLAAIVRVRYKKGLPSEVEERVREYGW
jgi:hypothetical protein